MYTKNKTSLERKGIKNIIIEKIKITVEKEKEKSSDINYKFKINANFLLNQKHLILLFTEIDK